MKRKNLRLFGVVLGSLLLVLLFANLGLNFWLQKKLPGYVKQNSAYLINYDKLSVNVLTGNIAATKISIKTKNPGDKSVLKLDGTVDSVSVARFGIYNFISKKRISSSDILLSSPDLKIVLAKPADSPSLKKKNEVTLNDLQVKNGKIEVYRHTSAKLAAVHKLDLRVKNFKLTAKSVEKKIPFLFDDYSLSGRDFYLEPSPVYSLQAKQISTEKGRMNLKSFALTPLLNQAEFARRYPDKKNLFQIETESLTFEDLKIGEQKITLGKAHLQQPIIKVFTTAGSAPKHQKSFEFDVSLRDVLLEDGKLEIIKPNGQLQAALGKFKLNLQEFSMNDGTAKSSLPFGYRDFKLEAQNMQFVSKSEAIRAAALTISPTTARFSRISVKSLAEAPPEKATADLRLQDLRLKISEWKFIKNKLRLEVENITADRLTGKITAPKRPQTQKTRAFEALALPLVIKNVALKNSDLSYEKDSAPLSLVGVNANFKNISITEKSRRERFPFIIGNYQLSAKTLKRNTKVYALSVSNLSLTPKTAAANDFKMVPRVSRAQFIRMIPVEKDLYDLQAKQLRMQGSWDLFSDRAFVNASALTLDGMEATIFRSKIPKDDLSEKPMYSALLRSVKFPLFISTVEVKNSVLVYEEDTKKSEGPGKLVFNDFHLTAKNLNSAKMKGKPTQIPIHIRTRFMNASPLNVRWTMNTADLNDNFTIAGHFDDLPAARVNPFIEPYLKIRATGTIAVLNFDFRGNKNALGGTMDMKNEELKIEILKEDGDKNLILSALANIFVRSNSGALPQRVPVENVERDRTKSFFNFFWRGIEQGLKKTLIGKNAPQLEEKARKTVSDGKELIQEGKKSLKEAKEDIRETVKPQKKKNKP